jgi:hypothetical protein
MCEMHIGTLDFGTVLKDKFRLPDQSYSIARNPHKGLYSSQVGRNPPYWSSYMVDYEALTGLSLLQVPQ